MPEAASSKTFSAHRCAAYISIVGWLIVSALWVYHDIARNMHPLNPLSDNFISVCLLAVPFLLTWLWTFKASNWFTWLVNAIQLAAIPLYLYLYYTVWIHPDPPNAEVPRIVIVGLLAIYHGIFAGAGLVLRAMGHFIRYVRGKSDA